jgi:hypothetical protein
VGPYRYGSWRTTAIQALWQGHGPHAKNSNFRQEKNHDEQKASILENRRDRHYEAHGRMRIKPRLRDVNDPTEIEVSYIRGNEPQDNVGSDPRQNAQSERAIEHKTTSGDSDPNRR